MLISTKGRYALRVMLELAQGEKTMQLLAQEIVCRCR